MGFERWDVVTVRFPFTDLPVKKPRPALVLSGNAFNRDHGHVICCMITTGARSQWASDHPLADLAPTGLGHVSVVRWKVFTVPVTEIGKRIGTIAESDRGAVAARMAQIMIA